MKVAIIIFWISLSILFFCYLGYGFLLLLLNQLKKVFQQKKPVSPEMNWPAVTLIIAAYNEGRLLEEKLDNTKSIDYPADKLRIIFVTDGSTDGSEKIIHGQEGLLLLHQEERQGKLAAITRAIAVTQTDIVVFSDANSMLNKECIKRIVQHYADHRVGGVAGEKKIIRGNMIGDAEGLYWQYESFMKKQDAAFHTVVGAAGELFSIRKDLFDPPSANLILDDFVISMRVCLKGYKIDYEPGAFASELPSVSLREEAKRKTRISAGAYQSIGYLKECLNIFKHPLLSFQYISRRFLRWVVCPPVLVLLLVVNILLITGQNTANIYNWFFYAQLVFYSAALVGWLLGRTGKSIGIIAIPFYFLFMNYCLFRGFIRFLRNKQTVLWEKSTRQPDPEGKE